ncbi:MAG: hypothetical protein L3J52_02380, partial [Proteobacteria bacterium]|nr:hypothetical protein [Pseudomonadota bacterium]
MISAGKEDNSSAAAIVDSIASVTAHADRDMLERGLVGTLHQMMNVDRVALSEIVNKKIRLKLEINPSNIEVDGMVREKKLLVLDDAPHFKRCYDSGSAVQVSYLDGDDKVYHIYPILNLKDNIVGFIELVGDRLTESDTRLLDGLMQIYRNYMRILEESEVDTLTGLLNRRTFDRKLDQIL